MLRADRTSYIQVQKKMAYSSGSKISRVRVNSDQALNRGEGGKQHTGHPRCNLVLTPSGSVGLRYEVAKIDESTPLRWYLKIKHAKMNSILQNVVRNVTWH